MALLTRPNRRIRSRGDSYAFGTAEGMALEQKLLSVEVDLAATQRKLTKAHSGTQDAQSQLARQLGALQGERKSQWGDLDRLKVQLNHVRTAAEKTQSQLATRVESLSAEREALVCDLDGTRREVDQSRHRESAVQVRVAAMESDLAELQGKLSGTSAAQKVTVPELPSENRPTTRSESVSVLPRPAEEEAVPLRRSAIQAKRPVEIEKPEQQSPQFEAPMVSAVSLEEVHAAPFARPTETKAHFLSTIGLIRLAIANYYVVLRWVIMM